MGRRAPLVTVVIPTFNRAPLLRRSIESVLNQTFQDLEVIVVDDASVDNTEEVVGSLGDPRIRYLKHETNRGGSAARNTGIKAALADFIAFQDSDDEWLPEKLEKQVRVLADAPSSVGIVYTGFWRIRDEQREYIPGPEFPVTEGNIHQQLLKQNFVTTQAVLVRKECFQKAGMFDETLPRFQDWELFIRIAKHFEFRYVPEPLVHSFFTEGSISSRPRALISAMEIILRKHLEEYRADRALYSGKLIALSNLYRAEKDLKKSRGYLIEALRVNHRPGLLLPILASLFGSRILNLYWDLLGRTNRIPNKP